MMTMMMMYYYDLRRMMMMAVLLSMVFGRSEASASASSISKSKSIYDVLKEHGLPMGILPKGIRDYSVDESSGRFEVHLEEACNAEFENRLHYDQNVSGSLSYAQIHSLSGISAQDLFLWFPVKEIRVDVPSSGLIYFDVGVVSKQFSLSSFETPRECLAAASSSNHHHHHLRLQPSPPLPFSSNYNNKGSTGDFRYQLDHKDILARAIFL